MNGSGKITVSCSGDHPSALVNPQTEDLTKVYFSGTVNLVDANPVTLEQALPSGQSFDHLTVSGVSEKIAHGSQIVIRGLSGFQIVRVGPNDVAAGATVIPLAQSYTNATRPSALATRSVVAFSRSPI